MLCPKQEIFGCFRDQEKNKLSVIGTKEGHIHLCGRSREDIFKRFRGQNKTLSESGYGREGVLVSSFEPIYKVAKQNIFSPSNSKRIFNHAVCTLRDE